MSFTYPSEGMSVSTNCFPIKFKYSFTRRKAAPDSPPLISCRSILIFQINPAIVKIVPLVNQSKPNYMNHVKLINKFLCSLIILSSLTACKSNVSNGYSEHPLFPLDSEWLVNNSSSVKNGVYYYDSSKAENGVTLLNLMTRSILIDMNGKVLEKFPIGLPKILPDGSIVGLMGPDLVKFDSDMSLIWKTPVVAHHEITADDNGAIYLLSNESHEFMGVTAIFDVLKIFSSEGDLIYEWHVYEHLKEFISIISKSSYLSNLHTPYDSTQSIENYISQDPKKFFYHIGKDTAKCVFEFTHFNSIQVLPENDVSKKITAFKKGNLLLSFNPYSCYGILDTTTGNIEWTGYLPERTSLHTPLLTSKGTILVFQNSTGSSYWNSKQDALCLRYLNQTIPARKPSKEPDSRLWVSITEYDPLTNTKVWEYTATPKEAMQAGGLGSAERLPNGNTLICTATEIEGKGGEVFEVTSEKKLVWQYVSPEKDIQHNFPWAFYRANRISFKIAKKMIPGIK